MTIHICKPVQYVFILLLAFSMTRVLPVLAEDGGTETPGIVDTAFVETPDAASTEIPPDAVVTDEPAATVTSKEEPAAETIAVENPTAVPDNGSSGLADVVAAIADADAALVDASGEALPMAEAATEEVLTSADPWFVDAADPAHVIAYFATQAECDAWIPPAGYNSATCIVTSSPIQAAVDDTRSDGGTIHLNGSFSEAVTIDKSVTIDGGGVTTITASPESIARNGTAAVKAVIYIDGSGKDGNVHVTLQDLAIDGTDLSGADLPSGITLAGILVNDADVTLLDNTITNFLSENGIDGAGLVLQDADANLNGNGFGSNGAGVVVQGNSAVSGSGNLFVHNGVRVVVQPGGSSDLGLSSVTTDADDYAPGSLVTISGDNAAMTGYLPGETVSVQVTGPNGFTSACEAVVGPLGAWTCSIRLWADGRAVGDYSYTVTGLTSNASAAGTFSDTRTVTAVVLNGQLMNGSNSITVAPGSTVTAAVTVYISYNSMSPAGKSTSWHSTGYQVTNSLISYACSDTPDHDGTGTYTETFTFTAPAVSGTYNSYFKAFSDAACTLYGSTGYVLNGSVIVTNATSTAVTCAPSSDGVGYPTTCTAVVTNLSGSSTPVGTVNFSTSGGGAFTSGVNETCALAGSGTVASCSSIYTPSASGAQTISAAFSPASADFIASSGTLHLTVNAPVDTITGVTCSPTLLQTGSSTTCTAAVTRSGGVDLISGAVNFSSPDGGSFSASSCTLSGAGDTAACVVTYTPAAMGDGTHTIHAVYTGSAQYAASGGSTEVTVKDAAATAAMFSCSPGSVKLGVASACTITVTNTDWAAAPSGSVGLVSSGSGAFAPGSCMLNPISPNSSSCTATYTPAHGAGTHTLTAHYPGAAGFDASDSTFDLTAAPLTPELAFGAAPGPVYLGGDFFVSAASDSDGAISYGYVKGPCRLVDGATGEFSSSGAGDCVVRATVSETEDYLGSSADQTITIGRADSTITFDPAPTVTYGDADFTISAATNSMSAIAYSRISGPCAWVSGGTFTPTGAGNCVVRANTAATADFNTSSEDLFVVIRPADPILTINPVPAVTYGDNDFTVSVSTNSTASVAYIRMSGPCIWQAGGTFTPTGAGDCVIGANTVATADFNAGSAKITVTVAPKPVTVKVAAGQSKTAGEVDPVLTYTYTPELVSADSFTGSLARDPGEIAGIYAIDQGTLALSDNYTLTFVGGFFTILPKPAAEAGGGESEDALTGRSAAQVIPITGGEEVGLSCLAETILRLPGGSFAAAPPSLCALRGILDAAYEPLLPKPVPEGVFVGAVTLSLLDGSGGIAALPEDAHLAYGMNIPADELDRALVVYYWDEKAGNGAGAWVELPLYTEENSEPVISSLHPEDPGETRVIFSGVRLVSGHYLEFETNFSGLFLVVMK